MLELVSSSRTYLSEGCHAKIKAPHQDCIKNGASNVWCLPWHASCKLHNCNKLKWSHWDVFKENACGSLKTLAYWTFSFYWEEVSFMTKLSASLSLRTSLGGRKAHSLSLSKGYQRKPEIIRTWQIWLLLILLRNRNQFRQTPFADSNSHKIIHDIAKTIRPIHVVTSTQPNTGQMFWCI